MELRNFFKKKQIKNSAQNDRDFEKKNNKFLKVFGCLALATFMTATALFATAPLGAGLASAVSESETQPTAQEKLALGTLNLNPETDPVIYTTSSGLDIKFGGISSVVSGGSTGYSYITMGTYDATPVNWLILGYNSSLAYLFNGTIVVDGGNELITDTADDSPAGIAIKKNNCYSSKGVQNDVELKAGEVLLYSDRNLTNTVFNSHNYNTSQAKNAVQALYDNDLGLTEEEKNMIQSQTLRNTCYNTTSVSTDQKLFLFGAATGDNFHYATYGASGVSIWFRSLHLYDSGGQEYYIHAYTNNGAKSSVGSTATSMYVRPGMVLKLA